MNKEHIVKRICRKQVGIVTTYLRCCGDPIRFHNREAAVAFVATATEEPKEYTPVESIGTCKRCGSRLYPSDIPDYKSQCFECDEDFYEFEQETEK